MSDEELEGIIEEVDTDGSGTLDFDGKKKLPSIITSISVFLPNYINVKFPLSILATVNTKIICRKNIFHEVYFRVCRNDDRVDEGQPANRNSKC